MMQWQLLLYTHIQLLRKSENYVSALGEDALTGSIVLLYAFVENISENLVFACGLLCYGRCC